MRRRMPFVGCPAVFLCVSGFRLRAGSFLLGVELYSNTPVGDDDPMTQVAATIPLTVRRNSEGKIYSPLRDKYLVEKPEEGVRQEYLCVLVNEYGFALDQMDEELELTGRGSGKARADFVIWRTAQDRADRKRPLIVVECKSDHVTISDADYKQGENYARYVDAPFFVTHNNRETRFWRVLKEKLPGHVEEIVDIPHAEDSDAKIKELIGKLKTFREDEFAALLHKCHNVIRDNDYKDPAAAFDEIAKILFVKVYVERELKRRRLRQNRFTQDYLKEQLGDDPMNSLFDLTKEYYRKDRLFLDEASRKINLQPATSLEIVGLLERYNLSETSEDVKGIAFEKFLGTTFRGDIGQFFTPRPIVEFMVAMVDPQPGQVICDPASGSGGFLIRAFEIVRERISRDVDAQYRAYEAEVNGRADLSDADRAELLRVKDDARRRTLDQGDPDSPLWKLANRCLYGTDANDRMARTSKMNMIMHGDGHGGVHHHNGFLNVNGIFEGRFDIILTNPPFGSDVKASNVVRESDVHIDADLRRDYERDYGDLYRQAQARMAAAKGKPIASLFTLAGEGKGGVASEILFIERCLSLLKPGGQLGIVLPEGIFNNPSLTYVRQFCEDRAFIRAVVSLPADTFVSSGASVKASLLFMQKFTDAEKADYDAKAAAALSERQAFHAPARQAETQRLLDLIAEAKAAKDRARALTLASEWRDYDRRMDAQTAAEARALLKERFPYPIFLYEAERVGITATGGNDLNELYPNARIPSGIDQTCLELYRQFRADPFALVAGEAAE